jgi:hypothetical protein
MNAGVLIVLLLAGLSVALLLAIFRSAARAAKAGRRYKYTGGYGGRPLGPRQRPKQGPSPAQDRKARRLQAFAGMRAQKGKPHRAHAPQSDSDSEA